MINTFNFLSILFTFKSTNVRWWMEPEGNCSLVFKSCTSVAYLHCENTPINSNPSCTHFIQVAACWCKKWMNERFLNVAKNTRSYYVHLDVVHTFAKSPVGCIVASGKPRVKDLCGLVGPRLSVWLHGEEPSPLSSADVWEPAQSLCPVGVQQQQLLKAAAESPRRLLTARWVTATRPFHFFGTTSGFQTIVVPNVDSVRIRLFEGILIHSNNSSCKVDSQQM